MNTRALAAEVLVRVVGEGKSLTEALSGSLPKNMAENDRAFVQALCYGVARWYFRLDFILRQLAARPIHDEPVRMLALIGLFQQAYTRVKPYAAVAETVSAAGRKPWAKPLINAVLRNFQRQQVRLLELADAEESAAYSCPSWLIDAIRESWPDDCLSILDMSNQRAPMTLRVNCRRVARDEYLRALDLAGLAARPCRFAKAGILLENPIEVEHLPGFAEGRVSVQDEAAQLATELLALAPGQRVLDVCAAPGGKTLHILEAQPNLRGVTALDIAPDRIEKIRENLARGGLQARLLCGDAANPSAWWDGEPFDRILVDAPCSATGVIRRHPDIKLLRRPEDIGKLADLQRRILDSVWPLLAADGVLVYATCSILKEENEIQISNFLRDHPNARELSIEADWGRRCTVGRQILSGEHGMDGFFYARLSK